MKELIKITPPVYLFLYLGMAVVLVLLFPFLKIIHSPFTFLGIPLIVFGLWLTFWVDWLFKKKETTVKPDKEASVLMTQGVFCFSRHPMYLGFVSWLLGLAILSGNLAAFFAPIALFFTFEIIFIPYEEETIERIFGGKYREYKKHVRQWL